MRFCPNNTFSPQKTCVCFGWRFTPKMYICQAEKRPGSTFTLCSIFAIVGKIDCSDRSSRLLFQSSVCQSTWNHPEIRPEHVSTVLPVVCQWHWLQEGKLSPVVTKASAQNLTHVRAYWIVAVFYKPPDPVFMLWHPSGAGFMNRRSSGKLPYRL